MDWNVGDIVEGKITGISKFGAFVEMAPGAVGLVHISEISTEYVADINEIHSVGDQVKAKIISTEKGKISLSIKQLSAPAKPKKEFKEKKQFTSRPKYQSPGRPGDAVWETPSQDADMSFEDKLSKFKQDSDEKMLSLKRSNESKRSGGYRRGGSSY